MAIFSQKPTILYLTLQKAFYLDGKNKGVLEWNGRDFKALFSSLHEKIGASAVRIILGNDLSYILTLSLPRTAKPEEIIAKANELIPEEITAANSTSSIQAQAETDTNMIQVFAVANSILQEISQSALQNNINIEYLCPALSIIACSLVEKEKPVLFIWSGEEKLALVVKGKIIYGSEDISEKGREKITELLDYTQDRFGFKPTIVYTTDDVKDLLPSSKMEVRKTTLTLYPFVIAHSISDDGQNDFLTIKTSHIKEAEKITDPAPVKKAEPVNQTPQEQKDDQNPENKSKSSLVWTIILLLIIFGSVGFFIYQFLIKK